MQYMSLCRASERSFDAPPSHMKQQRPKERHRLQARLREERVSRLDLLQRPIKMAIGMDAVIMIENGSEHGRASFIGFGMKRAL